jgi:hypothetical protein
MSKNLIVKEVSSRKDRKKFVDFPTFLYQNNPYFTPPIFEDEMEQLSPNHPSHHSCEYKLYLVFNGQTIVGRVCAIINHYANQKYHQKRLRFNRIDMIDDIAVTKTIMQTLSAWAMEKGMNELVGPLGFSDQDKEGMLVEGFEKKNMFVTLYNSPYYVEHMKQLGFKVDVTWVEKRIRVPAVLDPKLTKLAQLIADRRGVKLVQLKSKNKQYLRPYIRQIFPLMNKAYDHLYGYVPVQDHLMDQLVKSYLPMIHLDYLQLVVDKDNKLIAFGIMIPSPVDGLKKHRGHLFPFGWIDFLLSQKQSKVLDMLLIAVDPLYKNSGVLTLIFEDAIKKAILHRIEYCESGPELETNLEVQALWKSFDHQQHKKRSCFVRQIFSVS